MTIDTPLWMQDAASAARVDRALLNALPVDQGIVNPGLGELRVTQRGAGVNMSVDVAEGFAIVQGTDQADQGRYAVHVTAGENKAIAAAHATLPRIDLVVLTVRDANVLGAGPNDGIIQVITGTADVSPTGPATPDSSVPLASVLVPAVATTIIDDDITDLRPWSFSEPVFRVTRFGAGPLGISTSSIQAALDAAGAAAALTGTRAKVVGQAGWNFTVDAPLRVPANVEFADISIIGGPTFNVVTAIGDGPGEDEHLPGVRITNVRVDQGATVQGLTFGILGRYVDDFVVEGCTVIDHSLEGIEVQYAGANIRILNNFVLGGWGDGIHIGDCSSEGSIDDVLIQGNYCIGCADDGIGLTAGVQKWTVTKNFVILTGTGAGIDISGSSFGIVEGNWVIGAAQHGIRVNTFGYEAYAVEIRGNYVLGVGAGNYAVQVFNANTANPNHPIVVESNTLEVGGTAGGVIYCAGSSAEINSNRIIGPGVKGIHLDGTVGNPGLGTSIVNNRFRLCTNAVHTGSNTHLGTVEAHGNTGVGVSALSDDLRFAWVVDPKVIVGIAPGDFENGWVNFGGGFQEAGYILHENRTVELVGMVKSGSPDTIVTLSNLAAGLEPAAVRRRPTVIADGPDVKPGFIDVNPNGTVVIGQAGATWTLLEGVSWQAA